MQQLWPPGCQTLTSPSTASSGVGGWVGGRAGGWVGGWAGTPACIRLQRMLAALQQGALLHTVHLSGSPALTLRFRLLRPALPCLQWASSVTWWRLRSATRGSGRRSSRWAGGRK